LTVLRLEQTNCMVTQ